MLNGALIRNPLNWVVITLMVVLAMFFFNLIKSSTKKD